MKATDAAFEVLKSAGEPLHKDELTKRMIESGLWQSEGKTPSATVSAVLGTEITEQGAGSRFIRREPNVFDLRRDDDPSPTLEERGDGPKTWVFQADPKRYDLVEAVRDSKPEFWAMNQHRGDASAGDRVYFFLSGTSCWRLRHRPDHQHCISAPRRPPSSASGRSTSCTRRSSSRRCCAGRTSSTDPVLSTFGPFLGRMGTNFPVPPSVAARLEAVLAERLEPVSAPAGIRSVLTVRPLTQPRGRGVASGGEAGAARPSARTRTRPVRAGHPDAARCAGLRGRRGHRQGR